MFELRRSINERQPDIPHCVPIYCVSLDEVPRERFESEEEANLRGRLLQDRGDEFQYLRSSRLKR